MSQPSTGLLDPLDGWPHVDPRVDYVRASIADLISRADQWTDIADLLRQAEGAIASGAGAAVRAADLRLRELALAADGLAGPLRDIAAVLQGYLLAYDRYQEEVAVARAVAREAVVDSVARREAAPHNAAAEPGVPLTPLRQRAWDLATAALDEFVDAGRLAASVVHATTAMIRGGWVNTGTACASRSVFHMLIEGGEVESTVRGTAGAVRLGLQVLILQRRGTLTADDVQRVRKQLSVGGTSLTAEDGRLRALAGAVATRAGVGDGVFALLGIASGIAQASAFVVGDAVTVLDGGGAEGLHAAANRTAAAANGIAGAQLAVEVFEKVGIRALSSVAMPVFIATSAYQLGDLLYTNRKGITATFESFAGHPTSTELP